jgi:hypothetical protein
VSNACIAKPKHPVAPSHNAKSLADRHAKSMPLFGEPRPVHMEKRRRFSLRRLSVISYQ